MEGEIPTLKCKAYITFTGKIMQSMTTKEHGSTDTFFQDLDIKKQSTGKTPESALRWFKASILGLPPEKKQNHFSIS